MAAEVHQRSGEILPKWRKIGGKRLLILVGLFFVNFIELGSIRTLSLILGDLTFQFDVSTSYLGTIYGILSGMYDSLSFVNVPLLRCLTVRQLTMIGGMVSSASLILASFAQTVPQLSATLITIGVGYLFIVFPTFSCLNDFFADHFEIASGVMTSGGSLGVMVLPLVFETMLELYGWRGVLFLLGGCNANYVMFGALLKLSKSKTRSSWEDEGHPNHGFTSDSMDLHKVAVVSTEDTQTITETDQEDGVGCLNTSSVSDGDTSSHGIPIENSEKAPDANVPSAKKLSDEVHDQTVASDKMEFQDQASSYSIPKITESEVNLEVETEVKRERSQSNHGIQTYLKRLVRLFGFQIFKERPLFIIFCFQVYLYSLTHATWLLFTIPNAQAKGLTDLRSAQVSIAGGVANFVGRLASGFVLSKDIFRVEIWYMIVTIISSIAFFVNYFVNSFVFLTILAAVFGVTMGFNLTVVFVLMRSITGDEYFRTGLSVTGLCYGTAFPLAGYIAGKIYDGTQSYNIAFIVMGGVSLAASIIVVLPIWCSCRNSKCVK